MAAMIKRWWQMIHNGGSPSAIESAVPAAALLDLNTGEPLLDLGTGEYLLDL